MALLSKLRWRRHRPTPPGGPEQNELCRDGAELARRHSRRCRRIGDGLLEGVMGELPKFDWLKNNCTFCAARLICSYE